MKMERIFRMLLCGVAVLAGGNLFAEGQVTIVVNSGAFDSVEEAAVSEEKVNWWDVERGDDRACTECFAAVELRGFLAACMKLGEKDISFARPGPLPEKGDVFLLGSSRSNPVIAVWGACAGGELETDESFHIRAFEEKERTITIIEGAESVGTLYGVYRYLEELGFRFYGLGDKAGARAGTMVVVKSPIRKRENGKTVTYEISEPYQVPSKGTVYPAKKVELPRTLDIIENPAFLTRGFWAWEDRGNEEFFLWMARNRMNLWTAAEKEVHLLKKLGIKLIDGGHVVQELFLNPDAQYPYNHPEFKGDEDKPKDPYVVGDEYKGDMNGDGKLTYFEAHPEWYGLKKGKRMGCFEGASGTNYCTSNEGATKELARNLIQCLIDGKWRHVDILNFWMLDSGYNKWCECDRCRQQGTFTDRLFRVVDAVVAQMQASRNKGRLQRDVHVSMEAYQETLSPPTKQLPKRFDYENTSITFFPIERCYVHSLAEAKCTEFNKRTFEALKGWTSGEQRHYKGSIFIGEYFNISRLKSLPILYTHIIASDIPRYYRMGAKHFHYMHTPTRLWGTWTLNQYLLGRLLWNPQTDANAVAEEYFRLYYPTTFEHTSRFYRHLESTAANLRLVQDWGWLEKFPTKGAKIFDREHLHYDEYHPEFNDGPDLVEMVAGMEQARKQIDAALEQCADKDEKRRLLEDERRFAYGEAMVRFYYHLARVAMFYRKGEEDKARQEFSNVEQLAKRLKKVKAPVHVASSHANAEDGLAALQAPWEQDVYEFFKSLYGELWLQR